MGSYMAKPIKKKPEDQETVDFEEVVRRLLAAPAHHISAKPPANGKPSKKKPKAVKSSRKPH